MSTVYKKVLPVLLILLVLIAGASWFFAAKKPSPPEISAYRNAISSIQAQPAYHAVHTTSYTCGDTTSTTKREIYCNQSNYSDEEFLSDGSTFSLRTCWDGTLHIGLPLAEIRKAQVAESLPTVFAIDQSYYRTGLYAEHIAVEKTDSGYVCTYQNPTLLGKTPIANGAGPIEQAYSVAYFDSDWNIQRFVITEVYPQTQSDGTTLPASNVETIEFFPDTPEEIDTVLRAQLSRCDALISNSTSS